CARNMGRHLSMKGANERHDATGIGAHVLAVECTALDHAANHYARLGIMDGRTEAGFVGCPSHHQLALAVDMVEGIVLAKPHHVPGTAIRDEKVPVAQPAFKRRDVNAPSPAGQRANAVLDGSHASPHHSSPSFALARAAPAAINRSAMMAMKATARPATRPRPGSALVSAI